MGRPRVTHRGFYEPLIELPMRDLTAAGLFLDYRRRYDECSIDVCGQTLKASRYHELIILRWARSDRAYEFIVDEVETPKGTRRLFVCPDSGKRSSKLFILHDQILSKQQIKKIGRFQSGRNTEDVRELYEELLGSEEMAPARGARRLQLVELLRSLGAYDEHEPLLIHAARPIDRRSKSPSSEPIWPKLADFPSGTLEENFGPFVESWLSSPSEATKDILNVNLSKIGSVEELTVARIKKLHFHYGPNLEGELRWASGASAFVKCLETDDGEVAFLATEGTTSVQGVRLAAGGVGSRLYFLCPVTGEKTETLFLRSGRFGGRVAQRMIYASQRA